MPMKPIVSLKKGDCIKPKRHINLVMVSHWKYAKECDGVGGGLTTSAVLELVELSTKAGQIWVKAMIPGRNPPAYLKISGEELGANFDLV